MVAKMLCAVLDIAGWCQWSLPSWPENWLMRQLIDELKLVYEVGFIKEKGKATARAGQWSPETGSSLLG
jgi:hypothetical protein